MKFTLKILYVLVCNNEDYYYEQFLLSATSLRGKMPNVEVCLMIDKETESYLNTRKKSWENLNIQLCVVSVPHELPLKERSRWLKTSMRKHIEGDFLFLDCDTIVVRDLSDIVNLNTDLGAVLDFHCEKERFLDIYARGLFSDIDRKFGFHLSSSNLNQYFNSGVIFCRDTEQNHLFFEEWHRLWFFSSSKGLITDQQSFYEANYNFKGIVKELDGRWNCQLLHDGVLGYMWDAFILHYLNTGLHHFYLLADKNIFKEIRQSGVITSRVEELLNNPCSAFSEDARIIDYPKTMKALSEDAEDVWNRSRKNIDNLSLKSIYKIAIKRTIKKICKR